MVFAANFSPFFAFLGMSEWVILGGIMILLFGGSKLPKLARSLGESFVEFKKGIKGEDDEAQLPPSKDDKGKLPGDGGNS